MPGIVRFEQDPDAPEGAGVFHFDAGKPMYAYEPDLAAKAGAGSGGGPMYPMPPAAHEAEAAGAQGQALLTLANAQRDQALASRPPGPGAPPPAGPPDMARAARQVMGDRAAEDILRGTKRTYVPGSPGVDPNRMRAQGVMVPTTANESFESNGLPYSPEAARERLTASHQVQQAQLNEMKLNEVQTQNQLASQQALAPRLQQEAAQAQEEQNRILGAYRTDRARLQQDLEEYEKKAHVNPDRFFQDRGVFATIGLAIAQGMGAYASTMTGAPNFAFEMTQKAIDRDVAAQRDEIEAGRVSRRNSVAQMMDNYGFDMGQAEAATRLAMTKSAEVQAQMFANESKLPHYQAEAAKFLALTNQENIKNEQALQNASVGKHTRSVNNAFVQPKAATGGGYVEKPLTPEEQLARSKLLPKEQGQDVAELQPKDRLDMVTKYGTHKQDMASLRSTYDDLADSYGVKIDWRTGALLDKEGKPVDPNESGLTGKNENIPGVGLNSGGLLNKQAANRAREARSKASAITGKVLSGASVSPQQAEFIQSYLLGDDDAAALRGLQRAVVDMNDVDRNTGASYPEEIRTEFDRRGRTINRENKSGPAPVKVSDY